MCIYTQSFKLNPIPDLNTSQPPRNNLQIIAAQIPPNESLIHLPNVDRSPSWSTFQILTNPPRGTPLKTPNQKMRRFLPIPMFLTDPPARLPTHLCSQKWRKKLIQKDRVCIYIYVYKCTCVPSLGKFCAIKCTQGSYTYVKMYINEHRAAILV